MQSALISCLCLFHASRFASSVACTSQREAMGTAAHMYTHMYIHTHKHTYTYAYATHTHICICIGIRACNCIYVCTYVYVFFLCAHILAGNILHINSVFLIICTPYFCTLMQLGKWAENWGATGIYFNILLSTRHKWQAIRAAVAVKQ